MTPGTYTLTAQPVSAEWSDSTHQYRATGDPRPQTDSTFVPKGEWGNLQTTYHVNVTATPLQTGGGGGEERIYAVNRIWDPYLGRDFEYTVAIYEMSVYIFKNYLGGEVGSYPFFLSGGKDGLAPESCIPVIGYRPSPSGSGYEFFAKRVIDTGGGCY